MACPCCLDHWLMLFTACPCCLDHWDWGYLHLQHALVAWSTDSLLTACPCCLDHWLSLLTAFPCCLDHWQPTYNMPLLPGPLTEPTYSIPLLPIPLTEATYSTPLLPGPLTEAIYSIPLLPGPLTELGTYSVPMLLGPLNEATYSVPLLPGPSTDWEVCSWTPVPALLVQPAAALPVGCPATTIFLNHPHFIILLVSRKPYDTHFYNHQPTGSNTKEVAGTQGFPFLIHLYVFIYYV